MLRTNSSKTLLNNWGIFISFQKYIWEATLITPLTPKWFIWNIFIQLNTEAEKEFWDRLFWWTLVWITMKSVSWWEMLAKALRWFGNSFSQWMMVLEGCKARGRPEPPSLERPWDFLVKDWLVLTPVGQFSI